MIAISVFIQFNIQWKLEQQIYRMSRDFKNDYTHFNLEIDMTDFLQNCIQSWWYGLCQLNKIIQLLKIENLKQEYDNI